MKILLGLLVLLVSCKGAEKKTTVSFKDIEPMQGTWSGVQDILAQDDTTLLSFPTTLKVTTLKDTLQLDFTFRQSDGERSTEKGEFFIHGDGKKLNFGPSEYNIESVEKEGDELSIIAVKEDEDNDKPADIRLHIGIRPRLLTMRREVKYKGTQKSLTRIDLQLTKNK